MSKLPEQDTKPDSGAEGMTLWEHLEELRSRLVKMLIAFAIGGIAAWTQKERLLGILTAPFVQAWQEGKRPDGASLHFPAPASLFFEYVRLSALSGLVFALPIMLYQIWAFIAPGLYSREKRYAVPFVASSCVLFAGGGYFGWAVAFPMAFRFLLGLSDKPVPGGLDVKPTVMISDYLDFVVRMLLSFGLAAELPVLVFFLTIAGLVTHKHLIKFFRYFLVLDFIVAAIVTPPDVTSQLMLAIPLAGLYIFSIGIAWLFGRKNKPPDPETEAPA
jgi:sec-independent protein translocase protein TatC